MIDFKNNIFRTRESIVSLKNITFVQNNGRGNCMYYAYGISLMYYLRNQEADTRDKIFKRLLLDDIKIEQLLALLNKGNALSQFTGSEINGIIEPILGSACRNLAAENTKKELLADHLSSEIIAASAWKMNCLLKAKIPNHDLKALIETSQRGNTFSGAEIFKVNGMDLAMQQYSERIKDEIVLDYNQAVTDGVDQSQIKKHMENIILDKVGAFFTENQAAQLNRYIDHLKKDYLWGSEETLLSLNRAISAESKIRDDVGQLTVIHDPLINLKILVNGKLHGQSEFDTQRDDLILGNQYNCHWVSYIPEKFLTLEPEHEKYSEGKPSPILVIIDILIIVAALVVTYITGGLGLLAIVMVALACALILGVILSDHYQGMLGYDATASEEAMLSEKAKVCDEAISVVAENIDVAIPNVFVELPSVVPKARENLQTVTERLGEPGVTPAEGADLPLLAALGFFNPTAVSDINNPHVPASEETELHP